MGLEKMMIGFTDMIKSNAGRKMMLVVGFGLIGVLFVSSLWPDQPVRPTNNQPTEGMTTLTLDQYAAELEVRVSQLLTNIDGVGKAQVMLTMENDIEYVYQSEEKQSNATKVQPEGNEQKNTETQEHIVMIEGDNGKKKALIKTQKAPQIKGIVVVCQGGGEIGVQRQIVEVLTSAFQITSTRVSVAQLTSVPTHP